MNRRGLLTWASLAVAGRAVAEGEPETKPKPTPLERAEPGAPLGETVEGKAVSLSDFAGKPVIVFFWASWCPYCRNELPMLERLQTAAGERMRIIAVNVEDRTVFRKIGRRLSEGSQMTHTYDPGERSAKAFKKPTSLPYTLVLRPDLSVAATQSGWGDDSMEFILKEVNDVFAQAKG